MLELRSLRPADVEDAVALSTQVGWNQLPADWERLLSLDPEGCFAGTVDGDLVATATVATYGEVSWIAMVLVEEDHRSQGYGSRIFERALEYAREEGGRIVGLDATPLGEPIYEKYGFETIETVFRWQGEPALPPEPPGDSGTVRQLSASDVDDVCAFDRRRVDADRGALLRVLLAEEGVRGYRWDGPDGGLAGYAVVRPGRTNDQIGPVVADVDGISPLLAAATADLEGSAIVDAPEGDPIADRLEGIGLERERELRRMTYPEPERALLAEPVRAFVDFAFG